jgi:Fe2+ transport system protein FeoA
MRLALASLGSIVAVEGVEEIVRRFEQVGQTAGVRVYLIGYCGLSHVCMLT